jgi:Flp pilus assembly protein protease CpaA
MSLLLLICFYDIKHKIIPTGPQFLLYFFTLLKIILDYFIGGDTKSFVWAFLGGILASLPFFLMWFFSKGKWIGFGDVKLALPLGWFVGFQFIIQSILISYIIGGVSIVIFSLLKKFFPKVLSYFGLDTLKLNRKTEVPFAPFLIAGFTLMFFFPSVTYYLFPFLM